uniref:MPN domain-containing protein n=1 Tax=Timema poppense TaxID=170557 RepID=A0A7R9H5L5_TIMPO|nr:unnamed protein product [Timema poppensis]
MQQHHPEEEEKEEIEEDIEDEEFIEEDYEENGERRVRVGSGPTGRTVTLQMLLSAGILQPGEGTMSIEYLGQKFVGDLLPDGKIKSLETDIIFASPSAWAIHCKRIINPEKKSGCGWASEILCNSGLLDYVLDVLDVFLDPGNIVSSSFSNVKLDNGTMYEEMEKEKLAPPTPAPVLRVIVKHTVIGNRAPHQRFIQSCGLNTCYLITYEHVCSDLNTLVECTPFSSLGKIQPFLVSMATNAVLVMDFHSHLTTSEVVGYLAGHWDVNAHNLAITHAFPCRSRLADRELAPLVEADIYRAIDQRHLTLVGWYHSHPTTNATPTLRDIDAQLDYEIRMKGNSDASYTPCVGVICSPYNKETQSMESSIVSYWVMPPPETKPHEYGKPMLMSYSVVQDQFLSQDALNEMVSKFVTTLTSKFPRDQSDGILWSFVQELVCPGGGGSENRPFNPTEIPSTVNTTPSLDRVSLLVPNVPMIKTTANSTSNNNSISVGNNTSNNINIATTSTITTTSGLVIGSDIASALFATGKFPSPSSLMGLTADPTRGILGTTGLTMGNMFIPPVGFKFDNISVLKPLSNSNANPIPSTSKSSTNISSEIISSAVKLTPVEPPNFVAPENLDKSCTVTSGQI